VLGIDAGDRRSAAAAFIKARSLSYPQLYDARGTIVAALHVVAYPETVVVCRDGQIEALLRGLVSDRWLRTHVAPSLDHAEARLNLRPAMKEHRNPRSVHPSDIGFRTYAAAPAGTRMPRPCRRAPSRSAIASLIASSG
jgi:hypothetical protein